MVADDLSGSSQSEDPLPRRTDTAHLSTAPSAVPPSSAGAVHRTPPPLAAATGDVSAGRVPLWNRLPRSIWLMSSMALANLAW